MTTDLPIEELCLPMPWGHVAVKAWGFSKDKHVLAIHGLLDNAATFDRLIPLLPRGYYFVCIDLSGHGLSSHFPAGVPLDYFNYILTIDRVLDYLEWKTCIYIGHSFGGILGLIYSTIHPHKMEKIICLDSNDILLVPKEQLIDRLRYTQDYALKLENYNKVRLYTEEEVMYSLTYARWCTLNVAAAKALMKRSVTKVGDKYKWNRDPRLNIGVWPPFVYEQSLAIGRQLATPTLLILSTASPSNFQSNQLMKISPIIGALGLKIEVVTVEGNHDVHNNYPERVASHISRYLSHLKSSL